MFTGIIQAIGSVERLQRLGSDWRLSIDTGQLDLNDVILGDSIAVNGCCLTVVGLANSNFDADVSNESIRCTTLAELKPGTKVNLEKAMLATGRLGGHIVSGHVDGVGNLVHSEEDGKSVKLVYQAPVELAKYIAAKGSICIDGISLTINEVSGANFTVNVIPHTQTETIISGYSVGQNVNLEVDLIARYLERLTQPENSLTNTNTVDKNFLAQHGFD